MTLVFTQSLKDMRNVKIGLWGEAWLTRKA
jgi:hypothetical protein